MRISVFVGTCLALVGASACLEVSSEETEATSSVAEGIRNGAAAKGDYSGVGALVNASRQVFCSGVMISETVVLTAAQCLRDPDLEQIGFSLKKSKTVRFQQVRLHPLVDGPDGFNLTFDVALAQVHPDDVRDLGKFEISKVAALDIPAGEHGIGVGFGESTARAGTRTTGDFLVTQHIPGEGPVGVVQEHAFLEVVAGNARDQMICSGDSGGPLFYGDEMVGLASFRFVETCAEPGPGYYVSLPRMQEWIDVTLDELALP